MNHLDLIQEIYELHCFLYDEETLEKLEIFRKEITQGKKSQLIMLILEYTSIFGEFEMFILVKMMILYHIFIYIQS